MTLKELYDNAKKQPKPLTPPYAFVLEVARVTKRSEITVRKWIAGDATPAISKPHLKLYSQKYKIHLTPT